MSPISVFIAQIMCNLGAFWRNNVADDDISELQAMELGDRVAEAGATIVMEMSARRSQRSFTQEMDRGTRGQGRPGHANNPSPPKLNVL